jgi:hypothetical protein
VKKSKSPVAYARGSEGITATVREPVPCSRLSVARSSILAEGFTVEELEKQVAKRLKPGSSGVSVVGPFEFSTA